MTNKKSTLRKLKKIAFILVLLIFAAIGFIELTFSPSERGMVYWPFRFLIKELPYRIWLNYQMRSDLDSVKKAMKSFLDKKYNQSFVIGKGGLGFSSISMYYWADAYLEDNPKVNFQVKSDYYNFSKRNYKKGKIPSFFYDGFFACIYDSHTNSFLNQLNSFYNKKDIYFILDYISGNKKDLETLNLLKIRDRTKIPKLFSDIYLNLGFYIDPQNFNKEKEAKLLAHILSQQFLKCKIGKYIVICRFFPKKLKREIRRKNQIFNFDSHPRESINSYYQEGHLINAFILCNFGLPEPEIEAEKIYGLFMYN